MDDAVDRSRSLHGEVKTKSAGTFVCEGEEATPKAKSMMEELELSLDKHRAQQFTPELAEWADIILAMGKEQLEHMEVIAPDQTEKMHTLVGYAQGTIGEPADYSYDIMDPYGEDIDEYRQCTEQLQEATEMLVLQLEKLTEN